MMRAHFQRDVERLKRQILVLSAEVESDVRSAVQAVEDRDEMLARRVLSREADINAAEVDAIQREIFDQVKAAVARDPARFETLLQVLNIARHLERIADHATNIAEDLIYLVEGRIVRHTLEVSDRVR